MSHHSSSDLAPFVVRFSENSWAVIVSRHEDREDVCCNDLWYTQSDIDLMKIAAEYEVIKINHLIAAKGLVDPLNEINHHNHTFESSIACFTGLERRLTQQISDEIRDCRARTVLAVLQEQKRQQLLKGLSSLFGDRHQGDMIALASLSQTTNAALTARKIGVLHQKSVM